MATQDIFDMTDTWNAGGTTFTSIKMNTTDSASASGSMLIDLQIGGTSQFHVLKNGNIHGKRVNFNIAAANVPIISVSNYSLTGSQADSLANLSGTWDTTGAPTAIKLDMTDTASSSASLLMDLQVGGSSKFSVRKDGATIIATKLTGGGFTLGENGSGQITVRATGAYGWSNDTTGAGAYDLSLFRDAANTLAQRNSTNAQAFRLYNTFTDASNYEFGALAWSGNTFMIQTAKAGTGSARSITFRTDSNNRWVIGTDGHFTASTDNTYDIGASGANRPRNLFVAGTGVFGADVNAGGSSTLFWNARSRMASPSDGVIGLYNNALTDFSRLQFGGTTASFPSLKRNGTAINVRLADDSGDAPLTAGAITSGGVAIPTISSTDTLSNKTLSSPTLSGTIAGSGITFAGPDIKIGDGTNAVGMTGTSPLLAVQGASFSTGITVRRDGNAEVGLQAAGTGNIGTWSAHNVSFMRNGTQMGGFDATTLFVGQVANPRVALYNNAGTASTLTFGADSGDTFLGSFTNAQLGIYTNSTKRINIPAAGGFELIDGNNLLVGTTTGSKIGTSTSQKLGFFNATPVVQPTAVADATDAASVITQLNALLTRMRNLGLIAT